MNNFKTHLFQRLKRTAAGLLAASLIFCQPGFVSASEDPGVTNAPVSEHTEAYNQAPDTDSVKGWPQGPKIEATSAVLMDVVTESVLYSKNADQKLYPASITKIMTGLLACENLNMKKKYKMSEAAAFGIEAGSSSIYGDVDEEFTVEQQMMALMLESANEMALALAEETSGSVKKFVELMNWRAQHLGCKNTHFNNPNGLHDDLHYTTANDMAKIAKQAWFNPMFRRFCTALTYDIPPTNKQPDTRYLLNHHKMMETRDYAYEGVLGGKTGWTSDAGYTLVTFAKRGSSVLMAVVMGGVNGAWADTATLLDYGFSNFEKVKIPVNKDPVKMLPNMKYLLKDGGNLAPFYYIRNVYVTVPIGYNIKKLKRKQYLLFNAAGPYRIKSKYYLDGHMVGWGMQYEKEILPDLLLQ